MARTHNITRQHQSKQRKKDAINKLEPPTNAKTIENLPRCHTIFCKIHTQPFRENRQHETNTQEKNELGLEDGPKYGFQQNKTRANKTTLSSTLQRKQRITSSLPMIAKAD